MLRHTGTKRTHKHDVKLAFLLSLTAGFVNATGFLGFAVLTTNVTGHAALFAERIALQDWKNARVIALWMSMFLAGAFVSSLIVSHIGKNQRYSYVIPLLMEIVILAAIAATGHEYNGSLVAKEIFAGSLLFAMGLQNALVSLVSGSVVRTTHLTGTFTDLGIELAQFLQRNVENRRALISRIKLRLVIITCFMGGALGGAFAYHYYSFPAFFIPVSLLTFTMIYDVSRILFRRYYQRLIH